MGPAGVLLLSIAIVIGTKLLPSSPSALPAGAFSSLAVLPMQSLQPGSDQNRYLAEGMSQQLTTKLSRPSRLRVTPWVTSSRFSERRQRVQDLGQSLNVDAVVTSTFSKRGDRIEVVLTLVDTKTGSSIWSTKLEEPSSRLFILQQRASIELATRLLGALAPADTADLGGPPSSSLEAYESYLQGAFALDSGRLQGLPDSEVAALDRFDQAIKLDPKLTGAYIGAGGIHLARALRDASDRSQHLENAERAFHAALELDPKNLAALRGMIGVFRLREEPKECLEIARRVPKGWSTVESLTVQAEAYLYGGLCDEAPDLLRRALELDPRNQDVRFLLVRALTWSGLYQQALETGGAYLKEFGDDPDVRLSMGQALWLLGQPLRAHEEYLASAHQVLDNPTRQWFADIGRLEKALGDPEQARKTWNVGAVELRRYLLTHKKNAEAHFALAEIYALLGNAVLFAEERTMGMQAQGRRPDEPDEVIDGYLALGDDERAFDGLHRRLTAGRPGQYWFNVKRPARSELLNMPGYDIIIADYQRLQNRLKRDY